MYPLRSTDVLARSILESIGEEGQIMRKYYQRRLPEDPSKDYYYIMRETPNTTSLLLEYGFIDNANDVVKLQNYLLDYVEAVVKAVSNYIGVPYISPEGSLENTYTVQKGDTLYSIAKKFNLTVDELKALNNLTSNNLSIGQVLIISEEVNIPSQPGNAIVYTVKSGDTLYKIANQFGITVNDIISANNLTTTTLQIGQVLTIPTGTTTTPPTEENYISYTVKSGDSLWKIANQYNTTVDAIKSLNNLTSNNLSIGQVLKIPTTESYINYYVKSGDSLWKIANTYGTTVDRIKQLNGLTSNNLSIGQLLIIPA